MSAPLHFVREGKGAPLILLHPVGLDHACWDAVAARLRDDFEVIRPDLPGHGRSPLIQCSTAPEGVRLKDYANAVTAMMRGLGLGRAHMVGLSFGGMIAQTLAIDHPDACAGLVFAGCPSTIPDADRPARAERGRIALDKGMAAIVETTLERWFTPVFRASGGAEGARRTLLHQDPRGWSQAWAAISRLDTRAGLATIRSPALCIAGEKDAATPGTAVKAIADAVSDARFAELPDAPHMMQIERSEAFACLIGNFLTSVGKTPALRGE